MKKTVQVLGVFFAVSMVLNLAMLVCAIAAESTASDTFACGQAPEPATLMLLAGGIGAMVVRRFKK